MRHKLAPPGTHTLTTPDREKGLDSAPRATQVPEPHQIPEEIGAAPSTPSTVRKRVSPLILGGEEDPSSCPLIKAPQCLQIRRAPPIPGTGSWSQAACPCGKPVTCASPSIRAPQYLTIMPTARGGRLGQWKEQSQAPSLLPTGCHPPGITQRVKTKKGELALELERVREGMGRAGKAWPRAALELRGARPVGGLAAACSHQTLLPSHSLSRGPLGPIQVLRKWWRPERDLEAMGPSRPPEASATLAGQARP